MSFVTISRISGMSGNNDQKNYAATDEIHPIESTAGLAEKQDQLGRELERESLDRFSQKTCSKRHRS